MAKDQKPTAALPQIELAPNAWAKFERFVKGIVKAGPQHRPAKPVAKAKKAKAKK